MKHEQVSALADGELIDNHIDVAFAAANQADGRDAWDIYHQIGDVLRSDDMAISLSPDFAAKMAARLEAEPTIIAPAPRIATRAPLEDAIASNGVVKSSRGIRRYAVSGMAAAAVAAAAFVTMPQLMVALNGNSSFDNMRVSASNVVSPAKSVVNTAVVSASQEKALVLRDPRIDEYMLAHQRYSPSVYNTAQFARPVTFATEAE
ncbi:MAG: sigma-E factor negative regulatory protein [Pseudomonadota bacterium]